MRYFLLFQHQRKELIGKTQSFNQNIRLIDHQSCWILIFNPTQEKIEFLSFSLQQDINN